MVNLLSYDFYGLYGFVVVVDVEDYDKDKGRIEFVVFFFSLFVLWEDIYFIGYVNLCVYWIKLDWG